MAKPYFKSEDVKVFPSAFRSKNASNEWFDKEAIQLTEKNLIRAGGFLNTTNSYIVSWDDTNNILICVIGGYYFEISNINDYELTNKTLYIKVADNRLASCEPTSDNLDAALETNIFYFTGISINVEPTGSTARLRPFNEDGNINDGGYLPKISAGSNKSAIILNKNTDAENASEAKKASGEYSTAMGYNTTASGNYSHAEGQGNGTNKGVASGKASHSEGYQTIASGDYSHAEGNTTAALAGQSHAEGKGTSAENINSHAEGFNTRVYDNGQAGHAEGRSTEVTNEAAHAEGFRTKATGQYAHAEGLGNDAAEEIDEINNAAGTASHSEGFKTQAKKSYSHTEGEETVTDGQGAHTEGYKTQANGDYAHAEGYETQALINFAHTEGYKTKATGEHSNGAHAEGYQTQALAAYAHSEGFGNGLDPDDEETGNDAKGFAKGTGAHSEGKDTCAWHDYSHTEGIETEARGEGSHTEGQYAKASGTASHAEGNNTNAQGANSHTEGENTLTGVNATGAHAEGLGGGNNRGAYGAYSHVEGYQTKTKATDGIYAHAEGEKAEANAQAAHAEGYDTRANGQYSHSEGNITVASGECSHTEGTETSAVGTGAHAEGYKTTAGYKDGTQIYGTYAHAEGNNTKALGNTSHTEGTETTANGEGAHAEGYKTIANEYYSHTEGSNTTANGNYAHAEGEYTEALGEASHTEGCGTIAHNPYETVVGTFNKGSAMDNRRFVVGNGTAEDNRSNAFEILINQGENGIANGVNVKIGEKPLQDVIKDTLLDSIYPIGSIYTCTRDAEVTVDDYGNKICPIQKKLGGIWKRIEGAMLYAAEESTNKYKISDSWTWNNVDQRYDANIQGSKNAVAVSHKHTGVETKVDGSYHTHTVTMDKAGSHWHPFYWNWNSRGYRLGQVDSNGKWKDKGGYFVDAADKELGSSIYGNAYYTCNGSSSVLPGPDCIPDKNGHHYLPKYEQADNDWQNPADGTYRWTNDPWYNVDNNPDRIMDCAGQHTHHNAVAEAGTNPISVDVKSSGEDGTNKNMPPYLCVYVWRRIG